MASGGGFYRRDASLTRQLQSSFSDSHSQATHSSYPPRQFDNNCMPPGPSQFQQFGELSSRMDGMMKMISDTQQFVFNNQAAQIILEEKLDNLTKAIDELKKKDRTGTPESGNTKLCKIPFELSVSFINLDMSL